MCVCLCAHLRTTVRASCLCSAGEARLGWRGMLGGTAAARSNLWDAASAGGEGGGASRMRCCSHEDFQGQDGGGGGWVRSICVATFDVGTGHTLEQVS